MTAASTLARARAAGLTLTAAGDRLHWRGPQPASDLRVHKPELLALLQANEQRALAAALLAAAERGAAAVQAGAADDIEVAEAAAIRMLEYGEPAALPSPDGLLPDQVREVRT